MARLVLSPRWIAWHLLTLGAMVSCVLLSMWQWHRAGSAMGSALNVGYGLQWPLFAVFFGFMWWRFLRLEIRELRGLRDGGSAEPPVPPAGQPPRVGDTSPSPFGVRRAAVAPVTDAEDPELAAYNRMLAQLAARAEEPRAR